MLLYLFSKDAEVIGAVTSILMVLYYFLFSKSGRPGRAGQQTVTYE